MVTSVKTSRTRLMMSESTEPVRLDGMATTTEVNELVQK